MRRTSPTRYAGWGFVSCLHTAKNGARLWLIFRYFRFPTPQAFYDQMLALAPDPATGKPDPARAQAFFAKYPESAKAIKLIQSKPISSGFENSTFNSLNAFRFINADGKTAWVRWSMVPVQPFAPVSPAHPETGRYELFVRRLDCECSPAAVAMAFNHHDCPAR